MKKIILLSTAMVLSLGLTNVMAGGDAAAGKTKAASCAGCHGPDGTSFADMYPNLKGQKAAYVVKQLKAFKDGTRADPIMAGMSAALSDADMADIAAFYATSK